MVRLTRLENNIKNKSYDSETYIERLKKIQEEIFEAKNKKEYSKEQYQNLKAAVDSAQKIVRILINRYKK